MRAKAQVKRCHEERSKKGSRLRVATADVMKWRLIDKLLTHPAPLLQCLCLCNHHGIMPPNRHRSSNPQGRQKSCSECAKAKRRCDLRQPSCLRCSRQGLTCSYPPQPSSNATPASQSDSSSTEAIISKDLLRDEFPTIPIDQDVELLDFDFGIGAGSVDVLNDLLNGNIVDSLEQPQSTGLAERTLSTTRLSPLTLSRLEYCFEQLKLAPSMMVSANCTPWSHAYLYDEHMPRSLQGCFLPEINFLPRC